MRSPSRWCLPPLLGPHLFPTPPRSLRNRASHATRLGYTSALRWRWPWPRGGRRSRRRDEKLRRWLHRGPRKPGRSRSLDRSARDVDAARNARGMRNRRSAASRHDETRRESGKCSGERPKGRVNVHAGKQSRSGAGRGGARRENTRGRRANNTTRHDPATREGGSTVQHSTGGRGVGDTTLACLLTHTTISTRL